MRDALGIDKSVDILDHVHALPDKEQDEAQLKLQDIERRAMKDMEAQPGKCEKLECINTFANSSEIGLIKLMNVCYWFEILVVFNFDT